MHRKSRRKEKRRLSSTKQSWKWSRSRDAAIRGSWAMAFWTQEKMTASASGQKGGVLNDGWFSSPPYDAFMFAEVITISSNIIRQRWKRRYLAIFAYHSLLKWSVKVDGMVLLYKYSYIKSTASNQLLHDQWVVVCWVKWSNSTISIGWAKSKVC